MQTIHAHAAGIDIGSRSIFVSVAGQPVVSFSTFTDDLLRLVDYLKTHLITTAAMEATGSYWFVLYDLLETAGIDVFLVNGAHVKNVPGRKSDVKDCQWLQQLHSFGLLHKSFVPTEEIRVLRSYRRNREEHLARAADAVRHMQKALDLMNVKVHNVISQLKGVSGLRMIDAILAGERDPGRLAALCDAQILKKKALEVQRSLHGNWKAEHLFALKQARAVYQTYQGLINECDAQIDAHLKSMGAHRPEVPPRTITVKSISNNPPKIPNLGSKLLRLTGGIDAMAIPGFNDRTFLQMIAETGLDLSRWATSGHFTSWLGLAPRQHQSGLTRKTKRNKAKTKAAQIFRLAAQSLGQSTDCALKGFHQRLKSRKGPAIATTATARKLAVMYYNLMRYGKAYVEKGLEAYQKSQEARKLNHLKRLAAKEGFDLIPAKK